MILSPTDLAAITGKVRRSAQARVLVHLGIPFKTRPDGSLVVFQHDLHAPTQNRPTSPRLRLP